MASRGLESTTTGDPNAFLPESVDFDGTTYQRLGAITDFRRDPGEARILYSCRLKGDRDEHNYILKVKAQ